MSNMLAHYSTPDDYRNWEVILSIFALIFRVFSKTTTTVTTTKTVDVDSQKLLFKLLDAYLESNRAHGLPQLPQYSLNSEI